MPQALNIGVDYRVFWELNPRRLKSFVIAYEQKIKRDNELERERMNTDAWLIGVYVQQAVMSAFSKTCKYPKKPIALTEDEKEHDKVSSMKAKMEAFAVRFNQQFISQEVK